MTESARPTPEQVSAVLLWVAEAFTGSLVASEGDFDREVQLFRARAQGPFPTSYELEISYEAFEDHEAVAIVKALDQQRAVERLRSEPYRRLFLDRSLTLRASVPSSRGSATSTDKYHLVEFPSFEDAQAFVSAMMSYVGTPQGIQWMMDSSRRVVVWQPFRFPPGASFRKDASTFYVSDGTLELARTLRLSLPPVTRTVTRQQLPADKSLLIGQQSDWL